jgi:hypothetical protein
LSCECSNGGSKCEQQLQFHNLFYTAAASGAQSAMLAQQHLPPSKPVGSFSEITNVASTFATLPLNRGSPMPLHLQCMAIPTSLLQWRRASALAASPVSFVFDSQQMGRLFTGDQQFQVVRTHLVRLLQGHDTAHNAGALLTSHWEALHKRETENAWNVLFKSADAERYPQTRLCSLQNLHLSNQCFTFVCTASSNPECKVPTFAAKVLREPPMVSVPSY